MVATKLELLDLVATLLKDSGQVISALYDGDNSSGEVVVLLENGDEVVIKASEIE